MNIAEIRREYMSNGVDRDDLTTHPLDQFEIWFQQAVDAEIIDPNAMSLATVDGQGIPSVRTVLLKLFDHKGFVFFTNYGSKKAKQLTVNPHAAALFPWLSLNRQIKIVGRCERVSTAESMTYFSTRPRGSQLGAWCSHQSEAISSRQALEMKLAEMKEKFKNGEVPLPSFWGGYRIIPDIIEFWQGRENRLHDRFQYTRDGESSWNIERLAP
jgi:pyridoxamine 5'-phosphate oxidase